MNICILLVLVLSSYGLILNETFVNPPEISVYEHMTANFGLQPEDSTDYSFYPLVVSIPDHGCRNILNAEELQGAIVVTKYGNCSYFDKAWNIASFNGSGLIVGNDIENYNTLTKMRRPPNETRDVDIPCVFVSKKTYDSIITTVDGDRAGTVFASLSEGNVVIMYFPDMIKIVTYLIVVFPALWVILSIIHCCHRDFKARRERQKRNRQQKKIPVIFFSKELLRCESQDLSIDIDSKEKSFIINDSCAVCLEDFEENIKLKLLACGHGFHPKCIEPWITDRSDTCPVCRETVTDKFEEDVYKTCCFKSSFTHTGSGNSNVEVT